MTQNKNLIIKTDDMNPILIMMVGISGSGKTTLAHNIIIERDYGISKPSVYSSNGLYAEWDEEISDQDDSDRIENENSKYIQEMRKRMVADLIDGVDVVYDAMNLRKRHRVLFLNEIQKLGCNVLCVCAMTPFDVCVKNNSLRCDNAISYDMMRRMYLHWSPPHYIEGFNGIIPVFNYGDIDQVQKYSAVGLQELFSIIDKKLQEKDGPQTRDNESQCHYSHSVRAYEAMFYLDAHKQNLTTEDKLYISNLIYYHMNPLTSGDQSINSFSCDKSVVMEEIFTDLRLLNDTNMTARGEYKMNPNNQNNCIS